ncbi:MAG TPA: tetratricopeptide repeat protein [Gemmatimonadales bacterium]|nr:tetratricopeptide repeat protein [Gemmatimonadales bacterium]
MSHPNIGFLLAAVAALVVARAAAAQCPDGTPAPCGPGRAALPRIQVLDLQPEDSAYAYIASGIAADVQAALLASHAVVVVGPRASRASADYVLAGSARRAGEGVVVRCRLERARTGRIVWTTRLGRAPRDLPALGLALATDALRAIGIRTTPGPAAAQADPGSYDLVMRVRYLVSRRTEPAMTRALGLAREAIARDSMSALAWAGLADALDWAMVWRFRIAGLSAESTLAVALAATERAAELAPSDRRVRLLQAEIGQRVDPTDRTASIRAYRAILAADSLDADAWQRLAMNLLETNQHAAAVAAYHRAVALDPGDAEKLTYLGFALFVSRQFDSAAAWCARAVAADPTYMLARAQSGQVALWRGRLDEAQAQFEAADRLLLSTQDRPGLMELARVLVVRGDTAGARAYVRAAEAAADSVRPGVHLAAALGDAYLAVGDTARAFWWLERYRPRRDAHFQLHLRDEPAFDGVRRDPRFLALVAP